MHPCLPCACIRKYSLNAKKKEREREKSPLVLDKNNKYDAFSSLAEKKGLQPGELKASLRHYPCQLKESLIILKKKRIYKTEQWHPIATYFEY